MEFNYFDLVVSVIILFLGLKGIINGFFKELFGLLGIVGGIFVASRVGDEVGQKLSDMIFKFDNDAAISFTGFLVTLATFWLLMVGVGYIFKQLSNISGLGAVDKIFGFVFGASKFFLIASIIAFSAYNIKAIKNSIDSSLQNSVVFPIMVKTGQYIMKIDPTEVSKDISSSVEDAGKSVNDAIESSAKQIVDETKEQLNLGE